MREAKRATVRTAAAALALWASETIRLNLEALPDPHEDGAP